MNKIYLSILFVFSVAISFGQNAKSPKMTAETKNVKVTYGQPSKKGRVIFGDLVPYGEVWRTGANEATEITFSGDVVISGKTIKAGTYTLFTIPQKNTWTIILNSELKQWGSYGYSKIKAKNVLSVEVNVESIKELEKLSFSFTDNSKGSTLNIMWDNVKVSLPIQF